MRYIFLVVAMILGLVASPLTPSHAQAYVSQWCYGYGEGVQFFGWYDYGTYADVYSYSANPFPATIDYQQGQAWPQSTLEVTGNYPGDPFWIAGTLNHYGQWSCYEYHY